MGSLLKLYYAKEKNIEPGNIYHISLMPCYDKKLEASRADFYNADLNVKDVDCVITAGNYKIFFNGIYSFANKFVL